ncbi:kinase-like domain-containing protein [Rhizophagus irregularis DAOM 181602=DAOM 197198]|nr:kinase-like domain-containing protein [Rhizophagus irregularis DAOM 181602=DAOM 197198]
MINSAMSLWSLRSQSVNLEKFKRKFEYNNDDGQTECINKFQTEWNVAKINSNDSKLLNLGEVFFTGNNLLYSLFQQ